MRRLLAGLVAVLSLSLLTAQISVAAVTPGAKCSKAGATSTYNGTKYTCVKSGKKLVWDKGVAIAKPVPVASPTPTPVATPTPTPTPTVSATPTPTPSAFVFTDVCQKDPDVPSEWSSYQDFAMKVFGCARPYRFLDVKLPDAKPITALNSATTYLPVSQCKLPEQNNYNNVGFRQNGWKFNGDLQIQVIPVEFTDYKSSGSPTKEYGKYLNYIKDMFYKLSDGNTRITFRTPDSFLKLNNSLDSYVINGSISKNSDRYIWKKLDLARYQSDIFKEADAAFNFTGIDMSIVLVPLSTPNTLIAHSPEFRMDHVRTNEGIVEYNYLMPPASEIDYMSWFGVEPFLHLHEFFHANGLLNDHAGDDMGRSGPNVGTGTWGAMSGMLTDFILWDKWLSGMLRDSQVICANPAVTGTYWIKPASYFGEYEKMLVIPLSSTKAIAIESQRAAGLNFKLPSVSQGALVYTLDTLNSAHDEGIDVIRPPQRTGSIYSGSSTYADAPMKLGESLIVLGYKITVVESGTFGDVIKVEKA
jgi:hypothetical protein